MDIDDINYTDTDRLQVDYLKEFYKSCQCDEMVKELIYRISHVVCSDKDYKPKLTNSKVLFSNYHIFVYFFNLLGTGRYQLLEDIFDLKVTDNIQEDIRKWLDAEFNKEKFERYINEKL